MDATSLRAARTQLTDTAPLVH
ncbi:MAG: hypothetical protein JWP46_3517, partial [Modestobacter sp.]|nr:hypothetical protein [Modestobacter sp.]